ncbi:MAG: hypothetical protein ACM336_16680 [Acidobacteriota bacterium]
MNERRWMALRLAGLAAVAALACGCSRGSAASGPDRFWMPFEKRSSPVLISIPNLDAYTGRARAEVVVTENIVSGTDAQVAAGIASFLAARKGSPSRLGGFPLAVSSGLPDSPMVLVGAFPYLDTPPLRNLRCAVSRSAGGSWTISERVAPWRNWTAPADLGTNAGARTYALVTRLYDQRTGRVVLALSGIAGPATQAAADCIMSSACLAAAVAGAPRDWDHKNLQLVLAARMASGAPAAPKVEAVHGW